MSFSASERARAESAHISIGQFNGSFNSGDANGTGSSIAQSTTFDASQSIIESFIEQARQIDDVDARHELISAAESLGHATDTAARRSAYERLIGAAANHMTIVAPFLPALAALAAS